jgi:1,4-dihydroxy-2-naphthoate octaprenyltransferase
MNLSRVLPADDSFVRQVQEDFRVTENGKPYVVRIRGEGRFRSSVFPESSDSRRVLLEFLPLAEWQRPGFFYRWAKALRFPYLSFSLFPLLLVGAANRHELQHVPFAVSVLLFLSVLLIHLSCNLWGDYEDHRRGIDSLEQDGGSGVIQKLWIPGTHVKITAAALMLGGLACGVGLLSQLPLAEFAGQLLLLGLMGAFGAASYSGWPFHYKYFGLGEPIVFLLSGPVVTVGAAMLLFGNQSHLAWACLAALPLSFLATLRLHGGNMQRIPFDTMAGVFTIARAWGFRWSKLVFGALYFAPFLVGAGLVIGGVAPKATLITFLAAPIALLALRPLREAKGPLDPACHELRSRASQLHLAYGLLYVISFYAA